MLQENRHERMLGGFKNSYKIIILLLLFSLETILVENKEYLVRWETVRCVYDMWLLV